MTDLINASSIPIFSHKATIESVGEMIGNANEIGKKEHEEAILNFCGFTWILLWLKKSEPLR